MPDSVETAPPGTVRRMAWRILPLLGVRFPVRLHGPDQYQLRGPDDERGPRVQRDRRGERFTTMVVSTVVSGACCAIMAATLHGHSVLFLAAYLTWAFAMWTVSFGYLMCWPDLLPRHLLAVACAAINSIAQVGSFLLPYAWGIMRDATGIFAIGLLGLAFCFALAAAVALASRAPAGRPRSQPLLA